MRETKVYQSVIPLNGHELNRLHRFIISPYFNQSESLTNLFQWIKEDLKNPSSSTQLKEEAWEAAMGKSETFNDNRFRKLQSDLLRLIEEFYSTEAFRSNPLHKARYLLDVVLDKNLEDLEATVLKSTHRYIEEQTSHPASFYYFRYEIEKSIYRIYQKRSERSEKSNIEAIALNLDRFYLIEKLRYYCTILNHQMVAALSYEMLFITEIIQHVKTNDYTDVPPIVVYYQILLTFLEPDNKDHYEKLKTLIDQHLHSFPDNEAKDIVDAALNYCLKRMNAGEEAYIRETFDVYVKFLNKGWLMVNDQITPWSFKNIVTVGLRLNEFNWVENFIQTYGSKIDEKYRKNALSFNIAQYHFHKHEFSKVIEYLNQVNYDDTIYDLNTKIFLMASYYELDELEPLNSLLDTFRIYLSRKRNIPKERVKRFLNTIHIVRKLAKIRHGDLVKIENLRDEINQLSGITSKNWILEKLEALKNK